MAASIANTTTNILLLLLTVGTTLASGEKSLRRELRNVVCPPDRCVLVKYTFQRQATECSSCLPYDGMYHCPGSSQKNVYTDAMEATFPGGFGVWSQSQCEHDSYSPSIIAFSGPSAWSDYLVPACPDATYCACDDLKDKFETLMFGDRSSLSSRQRSDVYWASLADGFTITQGFSSVSGGSWEHFDLVYQHGDGRRQFCSSPQSFSYSPQLRHDPGPHTYQPETYKTKCSWDDAFGGCDEDYDEISSSYCWWPPAYSETCQPKAGPAAREERKQPESDHENLPVTQAADTESKWDNIWGEWGQCTESCGGGTQKRYGYMTSGSGASLSFTAAPREETQDCNTHSCPWYCFGFFC